MRIKAELLQDDYAAVQRRISSSRDCRQTAAMLMSSFSNCLETLWSAWNSLISWSADVIFLELLGNSLISRREHLVWSPGVNGVSSVCKWFMRNMWTLKAGTTSFQPFKISSLIMKILNGIIIAVLETRFRFNFRSRARASCNSNCNPVTDQVEFERLWCSSWFLVLSWRLQNILLHLKVVFYCSLNWIHCSVFVPDLHRLSLLIFEPKSEQRLRRWCAVAMRMGKMTWVLLIYISTSALALMDGGDYVR